MVLLAEGHLPFPFMPFMPIMRGWITDVMSTMNVAWEEGGESYLY